MIFVIAEAGINHNGSLDIAKELIDAAVSAGADAVKFQTYDAQSLQPPGDLRDTLEKCRLGKRQFRELKEYCGDRIEFMSTPFDEQALSFLVELGIKRIKISSGGLRNDGLLLAAAKTNLPTILSTGMATVSEIYSALRFLKGREATLLHCVSGYPVPGDQANLLAMETMRQFGCPVGYSDHTLGTVAPIVAVALGATVIEKHLTLDKTMEGPDHKASSNPGEFRQMVESIRAAERMMGDGIKRLMPCEKGTFSTTLEREAWARK